MRFPTLDQQEHRRPIVLLHLRAADGSIVYLDVFACHVEAEFLDQLDIGFDRRIGRRR